ncbi:MAG: thioredoxin family protein [Armatimonadetes bacterium]|nr:thioredoxin family protein [Armatimonadota bacterium]
MMRKFVLMSLLFFSALAISQPRTLDFVTGEAFLEFDKIRQGSEFKLALVAKIKEGYHIQAPNPPEGFIATTLTVEAPKGFSVVRVWYPPTEVKEMLGQKLPLYEGNQIFAAILKAEKSVNVGKAKLTVKLRYQACDDKSCYPPRTLSVTVPVEVVSPDTTVKAVNQEVFSKLPKDLKSPEEKPSGERKGIAERIGERISNALKGGSIAIALVLVFVGGLLMNLSPCVFPMIPVVIGYFGQQAEGKLVGRVLLGASFLVGLVTMYATVGLVAALTRTMFGSFLQNPWVLLTVTVVLLALALSMFGVFEFMTPQSAATGFQKGVELVSAPKFLLKLIGAFLMGLLIGVVAAPCVGPAVIALLGAAPLLDPFTLFMLFVVLAFGLGLPYLLLAIFISAARKLRSGVWNVWVNRFFGVILLAAAIYFGYQTAYAFGLLKSEHPWQPYTPQALEVAIKEGKPVVIDFWATWCLACKELEHKTFSHPKVKERLQEFVTLQVDMTTGKDETANEAYRRFKVRGLPTVIFIGRDGKERKELRLEGFEPPEKFILRIEQALRQ